MPESGVADPGDPLPSTSVMVMAHEVALVSVNPPVYDTPPATQPPPTKVIVRPLMTGAGVGGTVHPVPLQPSVQVHVPPEQVPCPLHVMP